ncbi:N-acetyl-alpha-D-glucosaminyl-diphospho-ditrans,octacis-undecaprenol 4-epimerase [compost metagenome]
MRVFVTGANGFIGTSLCEYLASRGFTVHGLVRADVPDKAGVVYHKGSLEDGASLLDCLIGVDCLVHLAGRAHVMRDETRNPLATFRAVNCDATLELARTAKRAGVKRLVFLSSIGVNGAKTSVKPFDECSEPNPHADYALSKLEAEQGLQSLLAGSETELVIIRPPLVYGVDAPGNFARLLRVVEKGIPLPFGGLNNQRSMISLDNLVELIATCVVHPAAAGELFLAADGDDLSTKELVHILAEGMGRRARLFSMPARLLSIGATLVGKRAMYTQLCESLRVDASKARRVLGWQPRKLARQALLEAGREYSRRCGL